MRSSAFLLVLLAGLVPHTARGDVDFVRALRALGHSASAPQVPHGLLRPGSSRIALVLERTGTGELPPGAVPIHDRWFAWDASATSAALAAETYPGVRFHWAPPRRLLLERAGEWTSATRVRAETGLTGKGVVVGLIDSGVDVMHPDLRRADGSTRVRWLIDFGLPARGLQPELERAYGCTGAASCAVYSASDIDELITNGVGGDEPRDRFGHGTHVASLAAGNGLSQSPPRYVGVAPEADLVVARVSGGASGIFDTEVLRGARFVFDRAHAAGQPAVLNLSLGSDFGAHDGRSALERALTSFVGAGEAGRAIVVAAGNSAALYGDVLGRGSPLGVHTEVHVPRSSPAAVPLLMTGGDSSIEASVYVWLGFRAGDAMQVGLRRNGGDWGPLVPPGAGTTLKAGQLRATILNGVREPGEPLGREEPSAAIVLDGSWPAETTLEIRLDGHGTASLWVQSTGELDPALGGAALFPFAFKEGTINVPASAPALIAVGATLNRTDWVDAAGERVQQAQHGSLEVAPPDTTAYFSSAGPNALGVLKPDLVAPGAHVIGAMGRFADPRDGGGGLFAAAGRCAGTTECFVIDDFHAVASGTSMASPLVAGAVALLFERNPALTQDGVRALLQAGARPLEGVVFVEQQAGPGALDIAGSLAAAASAESPLSRVPGNKTWIALSAPFARPDPDWPLEAIVELRDDAGAIADGFDPTRLGLEVRGAAVVAPLARIAPGLYRFAVAAPRESGGGEVELSVAFDGEPVAARRVSVAVDRGAATELVTLRGGCSVSGERGVLGYVLAACAALARASSRRRRRKSRAPARDLV